MHPGLCTTLTQPLLPKIPNKTIHPLLISFLLVKIRVLNIAKDTEMGIDTDSKPKLKFQETQIFYTLHKNNENISNSSVNPVKNYEQLLRQSDCSLFRSQTSFLP